MPEPAAAPSSADALTALLRGYISNHTGIGDVLEDPVWTDVTNNDVVEAIATVASASTVASLLPLWDKRAGLPHPGRAVVVPLLADPNLEEQLKREVNRLWLEVPLPGVDTAALLEAWPSDDRVWRLAIVQWGTGSLDESSEAILSSTERPGMVRSASQPALLLWALYQQILAAENQHALSSVLKAILDLRPSDLAPDLAPVLHRVISALVARSETLNANWLKSPLKTRFPTWLRDLKSALPYFGEKERKEDLAAWGRFFKTGTTSRRDVPPASVRKPKSLDRDDDVELRLRDSTLEDRSAEIKRRWAEGWDPSRVVVSDIGRDVMEGRIVAMETRLEQIRDEKKSSHDLSGDGWHDNPGLNQLRQVEERQMKDIAVKKRELLNALVVALEPRPVDRVSIGSIVEFDIIHTSNVERTRCEVVGMGEEDALGHRVNYRSPIAAALRGLKVGDSSSADLPGGRVTYRVTTLHAELPSDEGAVAPG